MVVTRNNEIIDKLDNLTSLAAKFSNIVMSLAAKVENLTSSPLMIDVSTKCNLPQKMVSSKKKQTRKNKIQKPPKELAPPNTKSVSLVRKMTVTPPECHIPDPLL